MQYEIVTATSLMRLSSSAYSVYLNKTSLLCFIIENVWVTWTCRVLCCTVFQ